ncbi:leucine-rich repeat domain-containing protein [Seonamhaeicola algicola]|nr:leucine-rich repeat domain-containing protein [Seonamhaeicola algicola]
MKKNLLFIVSLFIAAIVNSQTFTFTDSYGNELQYAVSSATTVSLTSGSTLNNNNIDIPATVSNAGNTYNVTSIGNYAFQGSSTTYVSIPNTITSIGKQAFGNTNLTSVVLPSSLITIDEYAFQYNQLQGITIPENVNSIGIGAFRGNPLTTVTSLATAPPTITTAASNSDSFAVGGNRSNIDLYIPTSTTGAYVTNSGALWTGFNTVTENLNTGDTYVYNYITYEVISAANSTVKVIDYNTTGGTVVNIPTTIPNGLITYSVIEIGTQAFENKGLTDVTLPSTLTNIGEKAFFINNLASVTIPNNVTTINNGAFAQNQNMTNITLGNNVSVIGDYAFRFTGLTTITIPESVTNIGVIAFGGMGDIITDVYCEGIVPPTISTSSNPNSDTFNLSRSSVNLHIPSGTEGAYVTNPGALWTGFNSVNTLSASQFELNNQIKVITKDNGLEITSDNGLTLKKYSIYNITGAKITQGKATFISTETLSNGIYILELQFNEGRIAKKFVK